MRHIGNKRGSNLVFCIILVALLGLLAGGYGLLLSYNTNASVSQREFQQEYLTADSLRQSIVDSFLTEKNPLLEDMKEEITAAINTYLDYMKGYEEAAATEGKTEEEVAQAIQEYINENNTPETQLITLNSVSPEYHGRTDLCGASAAVDTRYNAEKRELFVTVNYTGSEHYVLSALLKTSGASLTGEKGIHKGQSGLIDYSKIPASSETLTQKKIKDGISCNVQGGDCSYLLPSGNITLDVGTIKITGSHRLFLMLPAGSSLLLTGQMGNDYTGQLILLKPKDGNGGQLTLGSGLEFYGQIYLPDSELTVEGGATVYGTITVGTVDNSPRNLTVMERFQGFEGTGISSVTDLGEYWGSTAENPVDPGTERDTSYDYLADLTGWEVERYYEE